MAEGQPDAGTGPPITRHVVSVSATCSRCGRDVNRNLMRAVVWNLLNRGVIR